MESAVGYVAMEDVYIAYSEYYGDGTIYGRVDLLLNGEAVKGAGKSKKELVEAGVVLSETVVGSMNGELVSIPDSNEAAPEVVNEVVEEVVEEVAPEEVVPEEVVPEEVAPEEVVPEEVVPEEVVPEEVVPEEVVPEEVVPEEVVPEEVAPEEVVSPNSGLYTVSIVIAGFTVTRELNVKINEESRQIYLSE